MKANDQQILTIFGASGDLTYRKLVPAVYDLYMQNLLPECFAVLGVSRTKFTDEAFREKMANGIREFAKQPTEDEAKIASFLTMLYYEPIDTKSVEDYGRLKERLESIDSACQTGGNYIFYLSTPPSLYTIIPKNLAAHGLNEQSDCWRRLIIEKPFGYDLKSAQELNASLLEDYQEEQIYRIDHYLGKETVQNLLVTRFANLIYEPLWNRNYIERVEITSAESVGVGDRAGYYDDSGAMRDMIQNHLLQLVGMVAMEPPTVIESTAIRNEILKVFQALRPLSKEDIRNNVIRGQYVAAKVRGEQMNGYREENGVKEGSRTPTYVSMKFFIDNWRWGGVPFYIRTGKRLPTRVTEIVIHFKGAPHRLFPDPTGFEFPNRLIIRIQPDEGILLKFGMKVPGMGFKVERVNMDFHYSELSDAYLPSAYERLLLDSMLGDSTLFARGDAVEAAWEFIDPIIEAWDTDDSLPVFGYPAGTWGPEHADDLIEGEGTMWRYPCKNLADDGIYCEL
ncbi:MAG: glucose-6-phosphate dehydrogenase [Bacteroidota bacterium]